MPIMYKLLSGDGDDGFIVFADHLEASEYREKLKEYGYPEAHIVEVEMTEEEFDELEPVESWADYW